MLFEDFNSFKEKLLSRPRIIKSGTKVKYKDENVDVVDLETAKYIKKFGFDKPTHWYWQDKSLPFVEKGLKRVKYKQRRRNHNKYDEWIYSAPTRDELVRWINSL